MSMIGMTLENIQIVGQIGKGGMGEALSAELEATQ